MTKIPTFHSKITKIPTFFREITKIPTLYESVPQAYTNGTQNNLSVGAYLFRIHAHPITFAGSPAPKLSANTFFVSGAQLEQVMRNQVQNCERWATRVAMKERVSCATLEIVAHGCRFWIVMVETQVFPYVFLYLLVQTQMRI